MPSTIVSLIYGVDLLLLLITGVAAGYWVYSDATARDMPTSLRWSVASVLFFPIGVYYLLRCRRAHERARPPTYRNRVAALVTVCGVQAALIAVLFAPPDLLSRSGFSLLSFVVLLPVYRYLLL